MTTKKNIKKKKNNSNELLFIALLIGTITILGLVFLETIFTVIMIIGILGILFLSKIVNNIKIGKRKKIINFIIIFFLICCILGVIGTGVFFYYIITTAPEFDVKKLTYSESTLVYDMNNNLIVELGANKRENINYDDMSEVLIDAIIATEDSRFFQHNGLDAARFLKASFGQLLGRQDAGGASTLSMQVIKNSFTSSEASGWKGIVRKFTDVYLSVFKLERNYTKQEIIEFYANNHFLGSNAYGVEQAAKTYFGKSASQLNLAEASLIVGLFKAPTNYNPYTNPEAATARRSTVLNLMYKHGYITQEEKDIANSIPVESLLIENEGDSTEFQGYIDTVVEELNKKYKVNPYNTPMIIYTNMDSKKQTEMDKIFNGETFKWENKHVQAGVAAIDVDTGKIIAIGAGRNRKGASTYNFATQSKRQIGSTSKPIIDYAPGMEFLDWSTYTIFDDSTHYYSSGQEIRNSDRGHMGKITLRTSLAQSRNVPALKAFQAVMQEIGIKKYQNFVESFGIDTEDYFHEAHSIGAFDGSNALKMAAAYAVFANGGYYYEPYSINKIIYRDTGEVIECESEGKRIISDSTAFMITDALITAVQSGLSNGAKISGYNIAAKTGTTNYDEAAIKALGVPTNAVPDAWLIGYDAEISIGLWYGYGTVDKKHYLTTTSAVTQRKRLFQAVAKKMLTKGTKFEEPESVIKVAVEKGTNPPKLASDSTPKNKLTYEYFKKGTEPTEVSIKYSTLKNASNLTAEYNASAMSMTLNWDASTSKASEEYENQYGSLGYKIFKDNNYIAFTTDTSYTLLNVSNPEGTYKIVTTYKNFSENASSGITYNYKVNNTKIYDTTLNHSNSTYNVGDILEAYDSSPTANDITVTLNDEDITQYADVSIIITNSSGNQVNVIESTETNTYTITYTINYETYTKVLQRTITIQ